MTISDYINKLGFVNDPFLHTNADKESDYLGGYFIKPDYFEDVWGDPLSPVSNIIYAPRGGGKTAQRIMIEKRAKEYDNVLTITYASHDLSPFKKIDDITIRYHLEYLNRLLLIAFFNRISDSQYDFKQLLKFDERQYLFKLSKLYLYDTPVTFPSQAINSLKCLQDRIVDIWNNFRLPISKVIKSISKNQGVEIDLSDVNVEKSIETNHKENLYNLIELIRKVGYVSVYVLIDKVDEQSLTGNDPEASFLLIKDLIRDLELLETPNLCFKFFLWDALKPYVVSVARPDRVFSYDLKWSWNQMQEMLNKRVAVFSNGKIEDILKIYSDAKYLGRTILFSEYSPRDCIRICKRILSEQFKENSASLKFEGKIVDKAISIFSEERTRELINSESNYKHLTKVNRVSFSIEELVVGKVGADSTTIRNIINPWTTSMILKKIGLLKRKNARAVNEYAFQDVRVAFIACSSLSIEEFVNKKVKRCKNHECKHIYYRDFDKRPYPCPICNYELY